jgi:hypothetical protein
MLVLVKDTGTGTQQYALYMWLNNTWITIATEESAKTDANTFTYTLDFNSPVKIPLGYISAGHRAVEISVDVVTAFNGLNPTLTIGDDTSNGPTSLMPASNNDLSTLGNFVYGVNYTVKSSVMAATTGNLAATYDAGELIGTSIGALVLDGYTVNDGDRVLVKDQTTQAQNGIYTVTATGDSLGAFILTRASDFSIGTDVSNSYVYVNDGPVNGGKGFSVIGSSPITVDTNNIVFAQGSTDTLINAYFASGSSTVGQAIIIVSYV